MENRIKRIAVRNALLLLLMLALAFPCRALTDGLAVRLTFHAYLP